MLALLQAAALALRASAIICPASPSCPRDNGCSFSANGASMQISCATDYYGGDLQLTQTSTLAGCLKACSFTKACVAASFVGGNCYMKSTCNAAQTNAGVIGVYVNARETTSAVASATSSAAATQPTSQQACPADYACPWNDGCIFTGENSRSFSLSCGQDFYGGDFTSLGTDGLASCTQACADNAQCVAASFVGGSGPGQCYLKDKNNGNVPNSGVDGISLNTRVAVSSSVASTSTFSPAPSSNILSIRSSSSGVILSSSSSVLSSSNTPSPTPTFISPSSSTPTPTSTPKPRLIPTNIVQNPSFETASIWADANNGAGAPKGFTSESAHSGSTSYLIQNSGSASYRAQLWQYVTVEPNQTYTLTYWARQTVDSKCVTYPTLGGNLLYRSPLPFDCPTNAWSLFSYSATWINMGMGTNPLLKFWIECPQQSATPYKVYIDDVSMLMQVT